MLIRPTSFGSHFSFSASGVLQSHNFDMGSAEARLKLYQKPDGSVYDADGTDQAGLRFPRPRRVWCQLKSSTQGVVATNLSSIEDAVGERDTLTVVDSNSNSFTCNARLERVEADLPRQAIDTVTFLEFVMIFQQLDDWV